MFNFCIFQDFILLVGLCVREMREVSVQGIFGYYKVVLVFSSLRHVSRGQHLFLPVSLHLTIVCRFPECLCFTVYSQRLCVHILFSGEICEAICVDLPTDLNHLEDGLFVMPDSSVLLCSRDDPAFPPQCSLSFPHWKYCAKAASCHHPHRSRWLQLRASSLSAWII